MGILSSITKLDRNFGWSFLGFVLAAIFGLLSLYTEFWKEASPRLEFELLSNAPVLDVREKLPDLEVLYQSQDIAKSGKTLSVLLVRAVNRGSADILSSYYDSKAPVGLDIKGGALIRADLSDSSNAYLRTAARVTAKESIITFEPVILERDEWFLVKALVLHNVGSQPIVAAHGKVAGQRKIPVVPPTAASEKEGFWSRSLSGDIWTQLIRAPAYFVGFILVIVGVVAPSAAISDVVTRRRRKRLVERFKERTKVSLTESDEFIFEGFMRVGAQYVQRLTNSVADPERLQQRVLAERRLAADFRVPDDLDFVSRSELAHAESSDYPLRFSRSIDMAPLIKNGFIAQSEGRWVPVPDRLKVATSFIEYIELVGATNV